MLHLATILHPTDFSEHSELAFRLACALARDYKARLVLLHVFPEQMTVNVAGVVPPERWSSVEEVEEHLRQLKDRAHNVRVESQVMAGDPAGTILRVAEETSCDVIVMGTHGRTALTRLLMGSVAEEVLRRAPCPVLTAKLAIERNRLAEENEGKMEAGAAVKASPDCAPSIRRDVVSHRCGLTFVIDSLLFVRVNAPSHHRSCSDALFSAFHAHPETILSVHAAISLFCIPTPPPTKP